MTNEGPRPRVRKLEATDEFEPSRTAYETVGQPMGAAEEWWRGQDFHLQLRLCDSNPKSGGSVARTSDAHGRAIGSLATPPTNTESVLAEAYGHTASGEIYLSRQGTLRSAIYLKMIPMPVAGTPEKEGPSYMPRIVLHSERISSEARSEAPCGGEEQTAGLEPANLAW